MKRKMKRKFNLLIVSFIALACFIIALVSFNINKANADTEKLGLSDFNVKSGAIITGMTITGNYSGEAIGKPIEFNMQKATDKGRIHIVTYAYDPNFWYGFHIFVGQRNDSEEGYLRFDAYADKVEEGVVTPLEYYFGKYDSSTVKAGDNFKLTAFLIADSEGNGYEYNVFVNDEKILSSKTPYIVKDGIDDLSIIAHGNKFLLYPESTYLKIWDIDSNEPETAENWMDDSAIASKDISLYNQNKDNINIYNIEEVAEKAASINLGFGVTKTTDGNIELMRETGDSRPNILTIVPKNTSDFLGNYAVKYKSINNVIISDDDSDTEMDPVLKKEVHKDGRIEIGLELNAQMGGSFISDLSSNIIYLRLDFTDNKSYIAEFFPNGMSGGGSVAIDFSLPAGYSSMIDFLPIGSEYTVEYGQFFYNDIDEKEKFINYVLITNFNGDSIYGHAEYGGSFIAPQAKIGGKLKFVSPPYICASKIQLFAIDSDSIMKNYVPAYEESGIMKNRDIEDILPIGQEGITYTTKSETNRKSIINIEKIFNDSKYEMWIKLDGDYSLRLAFFTDRANGKNATSGYHVLFTPDSIALQSYFAQSVREETIINNPIPNGVKTNIEIRVAELFVMGVPEGERITLYIDGKETISYDFGRQSEVMYRGFDGIMSGNGSVTIYPASKDTEKTNGLQLEVNTNKIDIGKRLKLDYSCEKPTLNDAVSYKIISGGEYAEITYNDRNETWYLTGSKNGKVTIEVLIVNEYGEFASSEFEILIGTGIAEAVKKGCKSNVAVPIISIVLLFVGTIIILKKKNEREIRI